MSAQEEGRQSVTSFIDSVYETKYSKSLRNYLRGEALPNEANYRSLHSLANGVGRPSLDHLHNQLTIVGEKGGDAENVGENEVGRKGKIVKFGWMEGVLMPCLLNIWGVMLFLRLSWVVGQAGVIYGILIVILANCITFITTLSMSAVATNGQIKGGGIYYMLSRSLGPEFGGSIGLMFTMANSIAAATYIIGFVNSVQDMCRDYFSVYEIIPGAGGGTNDVRILGTITLGLLLVPAIVGMDWVNRVQKILLIILIGSQFNFIAGAFMGPQNEVEEAQGFIGLSGSVLAENIKTDYRYYERKEQNFFSVFGVFFPAVTGIVAGANLSGDLKDPSSAIPKGTILAIGITFLTYIIYPIFVGAGVARHATGNVEEYLKYKDLVSNPLENPVYNVTNCGLYETGQSMCKYGTQNSVQVIELMSAWGPLIYVGCFAATLSSGIASLVGAPRVLQALAKDNLYPYIHVFAKGVGVNNDPIRGYGVVSVVSFICIMLGELNAVSSLLTNCFLASYSFINFSCFHATIAKSPGWRPSFKYYNSWLCLVGGLLCVVVMFLIDSITALITFIIALFLYKYVAYRKPDVNWGSSTQAQTYISSLKNTLDLLSVEEHVKNYRPQILLLSGSPTTRPTLVDFASIITKGNSLLCCANISKDPVKYKERRQIIKRTYTWLKKQKIKAFYTLLEAENIEEGSKTLVQSTGFGQLRPNILMVGYKTNWRSCDPEELKQYFNTLHEALNMHFGVTILRVQKGFDYSEVIRDEILTAEESYDKVNEGFSPDRGDDESQGDPGESGEVEEAPAASSPPRTPDIDHRETENDKKEKSKKKQSAFVAKDGNELPKEILNDLMIFRGKQKGTIDVWWLYDDGGLTVLLPYILSTRSQWTSCKLRIFALANRKDELEIEQRSMINLLNKFRIDFSDMTILTDINSKASESVRMEFNTLIEKYKLDTDEKTDDLMLTEDELLRNGEKTNRNLRLRELLLENSKDASLIIMTLPIPRKNSVNASLYMAWLEMLSKGMPPFLFIRGNQSSVLTFYS
ncbi:UNVERIFIED_CONTAM: hypothetical protein RMT77_015296 [Armadillidium vulgare]